MDQFEAVYESYKARQTTVDQENVHLEKKKLLRLEEMRKTILSQ